MAYSRYFGMRSFENIVRSGRFRAPLTADGPIKIGAPVILDDATPGFFRPAAAGDGPDARCGLAIFEHIQNKSDVMTMTMDPPYDEVPLGQYAQMMRGPGVKVWFKNIPAKTHYDGRVRAPQGLLAGVTIGAGGYTGLPGIGAEIGPAGDGLYGAVAAGEGWMVVENVNPNTGVVEARLTF